MAGGLEGDTFIGRRAEVIRTLVVAMVIINVIFYRNIEGY